MFAVVGGNNILARLALRVREKARRLEGDRDGRVKAFLPVVREGLCGEIRGRYGREGLATRAKMSRDWSQARLFSTGRVRRGG